MIKIRRKKKLCLKENIIVGRLIPAGTGLLAAKYRKEANMEKIAEVVEENLEVES